MIFKTIHLPAAYLTEEGTSSARGRRSSLLTILQDTVENCVVLCDDSGSLLRLLRAEFEEWDTFMSKPALTALKQLVKTNRIVSLPLKGDLTDECGRPGCPEGHALNAVHHADVVIGCAGCQFCTDHRAVGDRVCEVETYAASGFARRRRRASQLEIADGQLSKAEFETKVWQPVFRYAQHATLVDKYIARSALDSAAAHGEPELSAGYKRSLEWIAATFAQATLGRSPTLEFISGLPQHNSAAIARSVCSYLTKVATDLGQRHRIDCGFTVKDDSGARTLRHGRFLWTDQIALLVERGFDLVRPDGRIKDVVVQRLDDPGGLVADILSMHTLYGAT